MERMKFDEQKHEYERNGTVYTSVTQLLKKYGLSANYDGIPQDVLTKAANKGKNIHKNLELYINGDKSMLGTVNEVDMFDNYVKTRGIDLAMTKSEQMVYDDNYKIAGTVDIQYADGSDSIVADFKTTSQLHIDAVAWQLSIYNYLLSKGDVMTYYFNKLKVFHYTGTKLYVKDVYLVDFDAVKQLLDANLRGDATFNYVKSTNVVAGSDEQLIGQILSELNSHKEVVDRLESELDVLLTKVKEKMVLNKDYQFSNDNYMINYVHPQTRLSLDQTKVKTYLESKGEKVEDYMKTTITKDGVKAVVKR
jgi:hypothetical protein